MLYIGRTLGAGKQATKGHLTCHFVAPRPVQSPDAAVNSHANVTTAASDVYGTAKGGRAILTADVDASGSLQKVVLLRPAKITEARPHGRKIF